MNLIPRNYYLNDFFDSFLTVPEESNLKCDIYEKDDNYHIELDVPGFNKDDITIEYDKGYLAVTVLRNTTDEDNDNKNYIRRERIYSKYKREFYLGDVDTDNIDAQFREGVLTITVPKKDEIITKRQIEIK